MKAVVTGGLSGLGYSFTEYLLNNGYEVIALYNSSNVINRNNLTCIKCDLKNESDILNALKEIDNVDILINNASISLDNDIFKKTKEEFMEVLEVNVVGNFLLTRGILSKLNNNGVIINISSDNTFDNYNPTSIDYDVSKSGINMLTKEFSLVTDKKIICYAPAWINTDSVLSMNQEYLKEEMKKNNQDKLLDKNKLVEFIMNDYKNHESGSIVKVSEV